MIRCSCLREGRRPSPKSTRPKNMRSATAPMPLPSWWRGCFDASARGPGAQPQRLTAIVDREALGGQPINAEDGEMVARGVETAEDRQRADANRSEEHTSELQSLMRISYAVFCLKKKKKQSQKIRSNQTAENTRTNLNTQ